MLWWTLRKIRSDDWHARWEAAKRLRDKPDQRAVEALQAALGDKVDVIRVEAAQSLGRLGATHALRAALDHPDARVRKEAAAALGQSGSKEAIEALVPRLADSANDVRRAVAEALHRLEWRAGCDKDRAAFAVARHAWNEAEKLGAAAVESLLSALRDDHLSENDRTRLIEALVNIGDEAGRLGDSNAVETLVHILESLPLDPVSHAAASRIARKLFDLGDERGFDWALRHLGDAEGSTIQIIVGTGGEKTLRRLRDLREDPDPKIARNALRALAMMGDQEAIATLLSEKRDEEWAGHALTYFGTRNRILDIPPIGRGPDVEESVAALLGRIAANPDELPFDELQRLLTLDLFEVWYLYDRDPDPDFRNRFEGIQPYDCTELRRVIGEELDRRACASRAGPAARPVPPTSN